MEKYLVKLFKLILVLFCGALVVSFISEGRGNLGVQAFTASFFLWLSYSIGVEDGKKSPERHY